MPTGSPFATPLRAFSRLGFLSSRQPKTLSAKGEGHDVRRHCFACDLHKTELGN